MTQNPGILNTRWTRRPAIVLGVAASTLTLGLGWAPAGSAAPLPGAPAYICHRDSDVGDPYQQVFSNYNAILSSHVDHTGPVYPHTGEDGKWGDIIPPFHIPDGPTFEGKNWPEGEAIWDAGCKVELENGTNGNGGNGNGGTCNGNGGNGNGEENGGNGNEDNGENGCCCCGNGGIAPPTEAEVTPPGGKEVDLGMLDVAQRRRLAQEEAGHCPGAPQAGFGGASTGNGVSVNWMGAGGGFLVISGLAGLAYTRRRRSC